VTYLAAAITMRNRLRLERKINASIRVGFSVAGRSIIPWCSKITEMVETILQLNVDWGRPAVA
jgi:hypothetical protein